MAILNVKDIFHDLHQIPEIGFQEFKTSAYLADKLRELGRRCRCSKGCGTRTSNAFACRYGCAAVCY